MAKKSFKDRLNKGLSVIKSPTFNMGFSNINMYASTGNFALNRRLSGKFKLGYKFGRSVILGGEPGAGKSLHAAYVAAQAQREHNALVVWVDIEKASDDDGAWLSRLGVDPENLVYMRAGTVSDCKEILANMTKICREARAAEEEIQPIVLIFDSYSALLTESAWEKAVAGDNTGDQGQQAKQVGSLIVNVTHMVDGLPVLVIGMVHIYTDQSGYGEREKLTGGIKAQFMASYICKLNKAKLTAEDLGEGGNAVEKKKVKGIVSKFMLQKSRFSKPFEEVQIEIPYETGMDPYSGLFELMMQEGLVYVPLNPETGKQSTGWYAYKQADGTESRKFRKAEFVSGGHADLLLSLAPEEAVQVDTDDEGGDTIEVEMV